jgi:hypothetical protein
MKSNKKIFLIIFFLCLFSTVHAADEDNRLWQTIIGEGKFNDNTAWYLELQGRIKDDIENFDQGFFRPALNFKITDQSKFWIGYAYIDTKATDLHSYEDRWWQQFQYDSSYKDLAWLSRTRIEQRHLSTEDQTAYRLRQQMRVSLPINRINNLHLLFWDEVFWNINDTQWAGDNGFNQNRLFTGLMFKYNDASRFEIVYLNQYINGTNGSSNQINHVLSSNIVFGF